MAKYLAVGKSVTAVWRHTLNDDFFKYDVAYTGLKYLFTILLLGVVGWELYIVHGNSSNELNPYYIQKNFWLVVCVTLLLVGRILMRSIRSSKVHAESFSTPFASDKARKEIDVFDSMTFRLRQTLRRAYALSKRSANRVDGVFLAQAIIEQRSLLPMFLRLGIDSKMAKDKLQKARALKNISSLTNIDDLIPASYAVAFEVQAEYVSHGELLAVLIEHDPVVREVFLDMNIDADMVRNVLAWLHYDQALQRQLQFLRWRSLIHPKHHMDRAMTAIETPLLNQFGVDMTDKAAAGWYLPAVERDDVLRAIYELVANRNSVIVVGEPGVGKQRLLQLLSQHMVTRDVPAILQDKRLVSVPVGQLISGADTAGIAARVQRLFFESAVSGNVVLVLEDIDGLAGIHAGQGESVDVAAVVASAIEQTGVMVIATTHPQVYRTAIFGTQLGELLKRVEMPEPDTALAIRMVQTRAHVAEARHQVYFTYAAIYRLVTVVQRYVHDRFLPRKATEHLDRIALEVREARGDYAIVSSADVDQYLENQLHLPLQQSSADESELLLHLEDVLHQEIIGQDRAVTTVSSALRRTRSGIGNDQRPIAVFLFLGPTGVGKTALAKALAKTYFKDGANLLRLDMSEYQGEDGVAKLLGEKGQSSNLVAALRDKPFQVVLLDEFEKADQTVKNLFLQVFDDARLSDGTGKTADFTSTIIIATSNAGADIIQQAAAENMSDEELDKLITEEVLRKNFSPELLNRFDDVVIFHPLTMSAVEDIARLSIQSIASRLQAKGVGLEISDIAIQALVKAGYDRRFGARPLRRAVQQLVEEPIANMLLRGEAKRRDVVVVNTLEKMTVRKGQAL